MSNVLELQQVKCPSCGAVITSFNPFKTEVECPYCHNKAINPLVTAKKIPVPERLIVFKTNSDDFEKRLVERLVNTDYVPTNVFECINPGNLVKAYLPMFLYEGKYQSSWNCNIAYETNEVRASSDGKSVKNQTVKRWQPTSGVSNGNFAFLCLAYEGDDVPAELQNFTHQFPYNVLCSKEYDPDLMGLNDENLTTVALNVDADVTWAKHGDKLVYELAEDNALDQLGNQEIKDFRASASYDMKTAGRYLMVPFWFVYYTYNNERHYFIMDGLGEHETMTTPVDPEQVKFVKGKNTIKKIVKWCWLLAILLAYFAGLTAGLVYLGVWFVAKLIVGKVMDNQIKAYLEQARQKRQEAANRL